LAVKRGKRLSRGPVQGGFKGLASYHAAKAAAGGKSVTH